MKKERKKKKEINTEYAPNRRFLYIKLKENFENRRS